MIAELFDAEAREATDEIQLAKGQTYALERGASSSLRINVLTGCFWVTREGDPLDYFATSDAPLVLHGRGLVVLEGIEECNVLTRSDSSARPESRVNTGFGYALQQ